MLLANIHAFEVGDDVLANLREYAMANSLFWALAEGHACEISVRLLHPDSCYRSHIADHGFRLVATPWRQVFLSRLS